MYERLATCSAHFFRRHARCSLGHIKFAAGSPLATNTQAPARAALLRCLRATTVQIRHKRRICGWHRSGFEFLVSVSGTAYRTCSSQALGESCPRFDPVACHENVGELAFPLTASLQFASGSYFFCPAIVTVYPLTRTQVCPKKSDKRSSSSSASGSEILQSWQFRIRFVHAPNFAFFQDRQFAV